MQRNSNGKSAKHLDFTEVEIFYFRDIGDSCAQWFTILPPATPFIFISYTRRRIGVSFYNFSDIERCANLRG